MSDRRAPQLSTSDSDSGYRRGNSRPAAKSGGAGRQLGTSLIMALLIGGLVLAGWFIANQQQLLSAAETRAGKAEERLDYLEARLSATDSAMSGQGEETQEQLGLWESEIRKLWAVSNERNKKWIKDNEAAVKKLTSTLNGIEASNRDLNAAVGRHETAFSQQQALVDQLTSLELQIQQVVRGQRDLIDKVNSATAAVSSLRGTVQDNAEAVQAIDAYRVAVNSRLADIERRLGASLGGTPGQ